MASRNPKHVDWWNGLSTAEQVKLFPNGDVNLTDDMVLKAYNKYFELHAHKRTPATSIDNSIDWQDELRKCNDSPYYYATKYLTVNGQPYTTRLTEVEFNSFFYDKVRELKS